MNKIIIATIIASSAAAVQMNLGATESLDLSASNTIAQQDEGASASCYKKCINRGLGTLPNTCQAGYEHDGGLLCNAECKDGYEPFGLVCEQLCPSGFAELGTECLKPSKPRPTGKYWWGGRYLKSCSSGWDEFGVACLKDCPSGWSDHTVSCGTRSFYSRGLPQPLGCPADKVADDLGFCYAECPAGTDGVASVCWEQCPAGTFECGEALCLDNSESCTETIIEIAVNAAELAAAIAAV